MAEESNRTVVTLQTAIDCPLIATALAFMAGILCAVYARPLVWVAVTTCALSTLFFLLTRRSVWGFLALLTGFVLLGSGRYLAATIIASNDVSHLAPRYIQVTGVVQPGTASEPSVASQPRVQFILEAQEAEVRGEFERRQATVSGRLACTIPLSQLFKETFVAGKSDIPLPHDGDTITLYGRLESPSGPHNLGGFDYRNYLARQGIYATLTARRAEDWHRVDIGGLYAGHLPALGNSLRQKVIAHVQATLPPLEAGVLEAILLGDRRDLPARWNEKFEQTGTTHILATAGLHVGMVTVLLLGFWRRLLLPYRLRLLLTILTLVLYAEMAGGRPSVVRAVMMASIYLVGILLEREPDLPNGIALAALLLLLANPYNLLDAGFQLSFATVISIALLMPFSEKYVRPLHRRRFTAGGKLATLRLKVAEYLTITFFLAIAAQLGALPLIAYYFHEVSLSSVIANTLIVPIMPLLLAVGFTAVVVETVLPISIVLFQPLLHGLVSYVLWIADACSQLPMSSVAVSSPAWWAILVYYLVLWGVAWKFQPHRFVEEEEEDETA